MVKPPKKGLKRGDIVLVPFSFTDLTSVKVRPAVVVSTDNNIDLALIFVSSVISSETVKSDLVVKEDAIDSKETGLKKTSILKTKKIVTLNRNMIMRRLGRLSASM